IYLLSFVDERYYWWERAANVDVPAEGATTWTQLFNAIGDALHGISLDTIASAYGWPPAAFDAYQEFLPLLLDLAAFPIGHRVVRGLDGTLKTQTADTATRFVRVQLAANTTNRLAGGLFA